MIHSPFPLVRTSIIYQSPVFCLPVRSRYRLLHPLPGSPSDPLCPDRPYRHAHLPSLSFPVLHTYFQYRAYRRAPRPPQAFLHSADRARSGKYADLRTLYVSLRWSTAATKIYGSLPAVLPPTEACAPVSLSDAIYSVKSRSSRLSLSLSASTTSAKRTWSSLSARAATT